MPRLKVVDSLGFFTRGEKGTSIQTAVWIRKTSAADAKDTQKGFASVAPRRGGGDCLVFKKGKFFLCLKKTFSLGCTEGKKSSLWVLEQQQRDLLGSVVMCRLSCGRSREAEVKSCLRPAARSCCVSGGESRLHTWFPLSRGSARRSPRGKQTDRKLRGRPEAAREPSKELHALHGSELILEKIVLIKYLKATRGQKFCCSAIECQMTSETEF